MLKLLYFAIFLFSIDVASISVRPRSPPQFEKVFIIAEATDHSEYFNRLGTCFAVTNRHAIAAYHNLGYGSVISVGGAPGNIGKKYLIARKAKKVSDKDTLIYPYDVTFCLGNETEDWAILVIVLKSLPAFFLYVNLTIYRIN
jgi:hypothetical protein